MYHIMLKYFSLCILQVNDYLRVGHELLEMNPLLLHTKDSQLNNKKTNNM